MKEKFRFRLAKKYHDMDLYKFILTGYDLDPQTGSVKFAYNGWINGIEVKPFQFDRIYSFIVEGPSPRMSRRKRRRS